jgi:hypothetical protein
MQRQNDQQEMVLSSSSGLSCLAILVMTSFGLRVSLAFFWNLCDICVSEQGSSRISLDPFLARIWQLHT